MKLPNEITAKNSEEIVQIVPAVSETMPVNFAHHVVTLLPALGPHGSPAGNPYLTLVKEACKAAERINGPLAMAGRFEIAVLPVCPEFFNNSPRFAKARRLAWEVIRNSKNLIWIILTSNFESVRKALPDDWIGNGYKNVCIGIAADDFDQLATSIEQLRAVPARYRMLLFPSLHGAPDLGGKLDGIQWVVATGKSDEKPLADLIKDACRQAGVAFHFHQLDQPADDADWVNNSASHLGDGEVPCPVQPFGPEVQIHRPTISALRKSKEPMNISIPPQSAESVAPPEESTIVLTPDVSFDLTKSPEPIVEKPPETSPISEESPVAPFPFESVSSSLDVGNFVVVEVDRGDFERLDLVVRKGLVDFIAVGEALFEIRQRDLWRAGGHSSWAAYCQEVGELTKIHANRLIVASKIADHLKQVKPIGSTLDMVPRSESQVRPLGKLNDAEKQLTAWSIAVERANGQPTAKQISNVVAEIMAADPVGTESKPNRKQVLADTIGLLRAAVTANSPIDQIEILISNLEKLLKLA